MEEELKLLKQSLRSLVVSCPTTMTVSILLKDYRNMVGVALPLTKFGYRDPRIFLKERCGDIFVLEGPEWDPILTPRITENLKHLDQMVQRQRVQSSSRHKGKRRSVPGSIRPRAEQHSIARTFNTVRDPPKINDTKPPVCREASIVANRVAEPKVTQTKENDYVSKRQDISKENGYKPRHETHDPANTHNYDKENINTNSVVENGAGTDLSKFYKKRLPRYNSDMDLPSPNADRASKESPDSGRPSSSSSQQGASKHARLDELRAELLALIKDSADGVWCTDLIRLYSETYGRELNFNRFGYTSIISFVYSMEDRVTITRPAPAGDWLLQDPSVASVQRSGPARRLPARCAPRYVSTRELPADEDALPGVEFEPDVFPADCVHYMDSIAPQPLGALAAGAQFEVLVGEVYSPSHFWILRVGDEYNMAMEQVMDEMTEYYSSGEGAARVLARGALRVGQYCASVYDGDWHRALIVGLIDSDSVKVRHVDYGTVETVPVAALKPLKREWAALAAQAVRARLAGCRPCCGGRRWPRAACAWFLDRVRDKRLYARLVALDLEEDILETFITDTSGAEDMCLTRDLIRVGHADRRSDSALRTDEWYLYPRFEALESGDTPNYADICRFLADGLALEFVDAYRRHVPGPWLSRPTFSSGELERPPSRTSLQSTEPAPLPLRLNTASAELARPPLRPSLLSAELPRPLLRPNLASAELARPPLRPSLLSAEQPRPLLRPNLASAELTRPPLRPSLLSAEQPRPLLRPNLASAKLARPPLRPSLLSAEQPRPLLRPNLSSAELPRPLLRPNLASAELARPPLKPSQLFSEPPPLLLRPSLPSPELACTLLSPRQSSPELACPLVSPRQLSPELACPLLSPRHSSAERSPPSAAELPQPLELLNRVPLLPLVQPRAAPPPPLAQPHGALPMPLAQPRGAPPPLPRGVRPPPGFEVRMTDADWSVLAHLRLADPEAAHWYLLSVAWRANMSPPGL